MDSKLITAMQITAAKAALGYLPEGQIIGIGSGRTIKHFIDLLTPDRITGAIASSTATAELLKAASIPVVELNEVSELGVYIDGADAYNSLRELVKGGGGALAREKILATVSKQFICVVDASKQASVLGTFPVPIEVIPMARSFVARELVKLGGQPKYRDKFVTDNGNIILDVSGWQISNPIELETKLNQIPGIVANGIFAARRADKILIGSEHTVQEL